MAGRARRRTRRNLLFIALAVLVVFGLIVATAIFGRDPVRLYPPESPESLAQRQSPENGWELFAQAFAQLPLAPGLTQMEDGQIYEAVHGSIGHLLNIQRPDDDLALAEFFHGMAPTLAIVEQGLARPILMHPVSDNGWHRDADAFLHRLVVLLAGTGRWNAEIEQDCTMGFRRILDGYALAQRMTADLESSATGLTPLRELCKAAHNAACPPDALRTALNRLTEQGRLYPDAQAALETEWQNLQRFADARVARDSAAGRVGRVILMTRRVDAQFRWILERREELMEIVGLAPDVFDSRQSEFRDRPEHLWYDGDALSRVRRINRIHYQSWAAYEMTRIVLALELYKAQAGGYPASIDALAPEFLDAVPPDPLNGKVFGYTAAEQGYELKSSAPSTGQDSYTPRVNFLDATADVYL
jgi:hypothetical protein